jgi:hypothetical protein
MISKGGIKPRLMVKSGVQHPVEISGLSKMPET